MRDKPERYTYVPRKIKIKAGEYLYRGYEIVRSDPQTWTGKTYWRIFRQGERGVQALRHIGTLEAAIREIDLDLARIVIEEDEV